MAPFSTSHIGCSFPMFLNPSWRPLTVRPTMSTTACCWPQDGPCLATAIPCTLLASAQQTRHWRSHTHLQATTQHTCADCRCCLPQPNLGEPWTAVLPCCKMDLQVLKVRVTPATKGTGCSMTIGRQTHHVCQTQALPYTTLPLRGEAAAQRLDPIGAESQSTSTALACLTPTFGVETLCLPKAHL